MSKRRPFDIEAAQRRIDQLEDMRDYVPEDVSLSMKTEIEKLQRKIYEEEDRLAQEMFEDPETVARDEEMKQKNKEAMDRWRAEHGSETCVADPNK